MRLPGQAAEANVLATAIASGKICTPCPAGGTNVNPNRSPRCTCQAGSYWFAAGTPVPTCVSCGSQATTSVIDATDVSTCGRWLQPEQAAALALLPYCSPAHAPSSSTVSHQRSCLHVQASSGWRQPIGLAA
jgi:hypothetical protein